MCRSFVLPSRRTNSGFTLVELLTVVILVGILASLAAPALSGQIARAQTQSTLNALRNDLFYARMSAVRGWHSVEVRFRWNADKSCADSYDILALSEPERIVKQVPVSTERPGVCLRMNNLNNPLVFNSRGVPSKVVARSFYASHGAAADSMRLSQAGRLARFY